MYTDIAIIIAIGIFIINGYHKGFVKSIYSVLSLAATVLLLFVLEDTFIEAISASPIGTAIGDFFADSTKSELIARECSSAVIYLVSCIILYIAIRFALKFVLKILDTIASLPVINLVNKFLGMFIGFIAGAMWIVIILNVLYVFPQTSDFVLDSAIAEYFNIIFI